jgi:hypothetical protein
MVKILNFQDGAYAGGGNKGFEFVLKFFNKAAK